MPREALHRFERAGKRYVIDPETCFCFECDAITWDVLELYPHTSTNRIQALLQDRHDVGELQEVLGELEWLRNTKSILPASLRKAFESQFNVTPGLKRVTVELPKDGAPAKKLIDSAAQLLLGRAAAQEAQTLEVLVGDGLPTNEDVLEACEAAFLRASLANKSLTVSLVLDGLPAQARPESAQSHDLALRVNVTESKELVRAQEALAAASTTSWKKVQKRIAKQVDLPAITIVLRPKSETFAAVVRALLESGVSSTEIDLAGAFVTNSTLNPAAVAASLEEIAQFYAERLLEHQYARIEPLTSFFKQIYDGAPKSRYDDAGTHALAVNSDGVVYPDRLFFGSPEFALGSLYDGGIDEAARAVFDDAGALTTSACMKCWARNLCGGGVTGVHHALTGNMRRPNESWCDGQRQWMETGIAAFNTLSSAGVNFTRLYTQLNGARKPSLFSVIRAAFGTNIGLRPLEEADAELLRDWENWSDASYFLYHEGGVLLATTYDREMDVLHPQAGRQELLLLRKDGTPFGLFGIRPERDSRAAQGWLYMRNAGDYESAAVQKGFRSVLEDAGAQQAIRTLLIGAAPYETPLRNFLTSVGFKSVGVEREALYSHRAYHDVEVFAFRFEGVSP